MSMRFVIKMAVVAGWILCVLCGMTIPLQAQGCTPQGELVTQPTVDPSKYCLEYLVNNLPYSATAAITSIAYAPSCSEMEQSQDWCGRLFFVRPDEGLLQWVGDFDPTTNQYTIHTFAEDLDTPNGLAWHDNAWYVAANQHIYRLADENQDNRADEQFILTSSLPHEGGSWTGSIGIGPDDRLYVSQGASCNACQEDDPRRAAILSYDLTGHNEQIYASGLRQSFDFAWHPTSGELWTADSERFYQGETLPLDELNRIPTPNMDFGWPTCYETPDGPVIDPVVSTDANTSCADAASPALTFPAHSSPGGMAFYDSMYIPTFTGDLLVVLQGSWGNRVPVGYAVYRVCFDTTGELETCQDENGSALLDSVGNPTSLERIIPTSLTHPDFDDTTLSLQELGFYPDHPVDIAVSPEGKIAVSMSEGRIIEMTMPPTNN